MITSMFYPDAITDDFDINTLNIEKTSLKFCKSWSKYINWKKC